MQTSALKSRLCVLALLVAGAMANVALADPPPLTPPPAATTPPPPPPEGTPPTAPAQNASFTQQQMDQMLAPIALYPDPLLAQIMMASTYPLEVVKAGRWSAEHPDLQGDAAVKAVADKNWDPSVKSLVAFPQLLKMMNDKLDWTEQLGDAFLAQQSQVNDTVQELRHKAMAANNLQSNQQVTVSEPTPQTVVIEPANPETVYVPYYDPYAIYGPWWWAGYPPVYWSPWPGYGWHPGLFFAFGAGIVVAHGFFYGGYDWGHRTVIVNHNNYYYHGGGSSCGNRCGGAFHGGPGGGAWQHDPAHRRGVGYPSAALSQRYQAASMAARQSGWRGSNGSGASTGNRGSSSGFSGRQSGNYASASHSSGMSGGHVGGGSGFHGGGHMGGGRGGRRR